MVAGLAEPAESTAVEHTGKPIWLTRGRAERRAFLSFRSQPDHVSSTARLAT
jgi:hypothetical protein